MKRATKHRLEDIATHGTAVINDEYATDILGSDARQRAEIRRLKTAVVELLKANAFGMSVTGGWEDAHLDPLYLQCANADRLGRAALAPKRRARK